MVHFLQIRLDWYLQVNPTTCIFTPIRIFLLPIFRLPPTPTPPPPRQRTAVVSVAVTSVAAAYLLLAILPSHPRQATLQFPLQIYRHITLRITTSRAFQQPQLYRQSVVITIVTHQATYRQSLQQPPPPLLTVTIAIITTTTSCSRAAGSPAVVTIVATAIAI